MEWVLALLESLRIHSPKHQLVVIPFDDRIEKLVELSGKYKFQFFEDASLLQELDRIGSCFSKEHFHIRVFRKFAAFWGPFDHFLFLDSDVVLLSDFEELFQAYLSLDCDFMGNDPDMEQVYKPGSFRESMITDYSAKAFNAGCFLSSKNVFTLPEVQSIQKNADSIKEYFSLVGGEQPFLNYCVHTKKLKYKAFPDVIDDLSLWTWAKLAIRKSGDAYRVVSPGDPEDGKRLPYIHWSGIRCNPGMPNRTLFLTYRLSNAPWLARVRYACTSLYDWWKQEWKPRLSRKLFGLWHSPRPAKTVKQC